MEAEWSSGFPHTERTALRTTVLEQLQSLNCNSSECAGPILCWELVGCLALGAFSQTQDWKLFFSG